MKILSSIKRWIVAKDSEVSDGIERGHEVQFAKQDLDNMKKDLGLLVSNVGTIKTNITKLKRERSEMQEESEQHERDAVLLLKAGREELAERHAGKIESLETGIKNLESSITQQEALLKTQQAQREKLRTSVDEAENSLRMMESMNAVAKSTEKISSVKIPGTDSALARFKERQARIQERLDKAQAIQETLEENASSSLDKETAEVLGKTGGSEVLARLKAKIQ